MKPQEGESIMIYPDSLVEHFVIKRIRRNNKTYVTTSRPSLAQNWASMPIQPRTSREDFLMEYMAGSSPTPSSQLATRVFLFFLVPYPAQLKTTAEEKVESYVDKLAQDAALMPIQPASKSSQPAGFLHYF